MKISYSPLEHFMPLVGIQFVLGLSLLLFIFGPWDWSFDYRIVVYLLSASGLIILFYLIGLQTTKKVLRPPVDPKRWRDRQLALVQAAIVIAALFAIPTSMARLGVAFPPAIEGLLSPGTSYLNAYQRSLDNEGWVVIEYFRMLFAPFLISFFYLTIVYWRWLRKIYRSIAIATFLYYIMINIASGKNRLFGDALIGTTFSLFILLYRWDYRIFTKILVVGIISTIQLLSLSYLFYQTQIGRAASMVEQGTFSFGDTIVMTDREPIYSPADETADPSALSAEQVRNLDDSLRGSFIGAYESATRYMTQGYQALAFSFDIEAPSTYGFGNSMFLARNADRLFETSYFQTQSIPGLLESESGWPYFNLWHSIYPWLASDVGWIGALLVVALFSGILAVSWIDALHSKSVPSIIVSTALLYILFYVPSSNAVLQDGEGLFAFGLSLLWFLHSLIQRRRQYDFKNRVALEP